MVKNKRKVNTIQIHYDSLGNTLSVWFDDPQKEYLSEETGDEVILNKDKNGVVIGFEKLNYVRAGSPALSELPVEVVVR
jgi:uncharacterized protein YuzE